MKIKEYLRRWHRKVASWLEKKAGWEHEKAERAVVIACWLTFGLPFAITVIWLANYENPTPKLTEVGVDQLVNRISDIKNIDVYYAGRENDDKPVAIYSTWNNGKITLTEVPRESYENVEKTILIPHGLKLSFKSDEERPGESPYVHKVTKALEHSGKAISTISTLFMLVLMANMLGFKPFRRFNVFMPNRIDGSMDDLVGMEDIKGEVLMLADLFERREIYASHGIKRTWNILFSGPAGVGKTKIASYLAKRLDVPMLFIDGSRIEDGFVSGGSRTLHSLKRKAESFGRCIVFIDEGQALLGRRNTDKHQPWKDDSINTFLSILDGVRTKDDTEIIWVIASNFDQFSTPMDEAVLRRFQLKINFRLPNREERTEMLRRFVARRDDSVISSNIDFDEIARVSATLSPAHLETIVDQASLIAIREGIILDGPLILRAFERSVLGLPDRAQTKEQQKERVIVAVHEAGHFLVSALRYAKQGLSISEAKEKVGIIKISIEAVSGIGALGYALNSAPEINLMTRDELEWQVRMLYGGRAAEQLCHGGICVTTGAGNDIESASKILVHMVAAHGMYSEAPINLMGLRGGPGACLLGKDEEFLVRELGARLYGETLDLLKGSESTLEAIKDRLLDCYSMNKDELFSLLIEQWEGITQFPTAQPHPEQKRQEPYHPHARPTGQVITELDEAGWLDRCRGMAQDAMRRSGLSYGLYIDLFSEMVDEATSSLPEAVAKRAKEQALDWDYATPEARQLQQDWNGLCCTK